MADKESGKSSGGGLTTNDELKLKKIQAKSGFRNRRRTVLSALTNDNVGKSELKHELCALETTLREVLAILSKLARQYGQNNDKENSERMIREADSIADLYAKAVTETSEFPSQMSSYGSSRSGSMTEFSTVYYSCNRSKADAYLKYLPEHEAVRVRTCSYDLIESEVSTGSLMGVPDVSHATTNFPNMSQMMTGTDTRVKQESAESGPAESPIAPSASNLWPADARSTEQVLRRTLRPEEVPSDSYSQATNNYLTGASFTSVKVEQDIVPTVTSAASTATAACGRTSESQNLGLNQNQPSLSGTTSGNSMTENSSTGNFSASLAVPPLASLVNFVASSSVASSSVASSSVASSSVASSSVASSSVASSSVASSSVSSSSVAPSSVASSSVASSSVASSSVASSSVASSSVASSSVASSSVASSSVASSSVASSSVASSSVASSTVAPSSVASSSVASSSVASSSVASSSAASSFVASSSVASLGAHASATVMSNARPYWSTTPTVMQTL